MKKTAVMLLTLLVAIAGIGLPIWLAIEESQRQAFKAESGSAMSKATVCCARPSSARRSRSNWGR